LLIGVTAAGFGVPGPKSTVIFYLVAWGAARRRAQPRRMTEVQHF